MEHRCLDQFSVSGHLQYLNFILTMSLLDSETNSRIINSSMTGEDLPEKRMPRDYFIEEQTRALDYFLEQSSDIYNKTAVLFGTRFEYDADMLVTTKGQELQRQFDRNTKEFEAYCLLNKKVQYRNEVIDNFLKAGRRKNWLRTLFTAWRNYKDNIIEKKKNIQQAINHYEKRRLKKMLKGWQSIAMSQTKLKIKNNVLRKTEVEFTRIEREYEKIIKELEETLSSKLLELKKETEEHKVLHDKFQSMYSRSKVE